jgi:galactokinase
MNFQAKFNKSPEVEAIAPGRVNLLGEHTDYNDGFVLPTAIPQTTTVQLALSGDNNYHFYSQDLDERVSIVDINSTTSGFASYVLGCIQVLQKFGHNIPSLCVYVKSSIPIGSGLSSSAALEVATLRAIRQFFNLPLSDVEIAQVAQFAEIDYVGVRCGIMDQMASSLADTEHVLFLDTRSLERRILSFPYGAEILVIDSGIPRSLASSGYNQRRQECEEAAQLLGVQSLRDVSDVAVVEILPEPLRRRARHVVTENNRVLKAVEIMVETRQHRVGVSLDCHELGRLINASHASLRDDYEVSVPPLDSLVAILQQTPGVFGARLTGAGFGGACVALVMVNQAQRIAREVLEKYQNLGFNGKTLVPTS